MEGKRWGREFVCSGNKSEKCVSGAAEGNLQPPEPGR